MADIDKINRFIQDWLRQSKSSQVSAIDAAKWLDRADLLKDSKSRPGLPLRKLLRDHLIVGQVQEVNDRWFIRRVDSSNVKEHQ